MGDILPLMVAVQDVLPLIESQRVALDLVQRSREMVVDFEGEKEGEAESVYVSIPNPLSPMLLIITSIPHALRISSFDQ